MVIARRELNRAAKRAETAASGNGADPAAAQPSGSPSGAGAG
jgi:hypothetical protein